jgi:3-oxoacyl-[acyl-carrier protein] reductase
MASIAGQMGKPGQINYASSKAGLIAMAKTVAKEMGSRGIRANVIAPGFIVSEMTNALPEADREEYIKSIPLKRGGTVEEIANTALYLASDLSSYVTGQVIAVNGGLYC